MALLTNTTWVIWGTLSLLSLSQSAQAEQGWVQLNLYDKTVTCHPETATCYHQGSIAHPEYFDVQATISTNTSRYYPQGFRLSFELSRHSGAKATVEVDIPVGSGIGGPTKGPFVTYKEHKNNKRVFNSRKAKASIALPAQMLGSSKSCACWDGRMAIQFLDPGTDGVLGNQDDHVRRISMGVFGYSFQFCRKAKMMTIPQDIDIVPIESCPPGYDGDSIEGGDGFGEDGSTGGTTGEDGECGGEEDDDYYEDSGCYVDDSDPCYDDSGCETNESEYDSEGCESNESEYDSEGCEGDTSSSSSDSGCEEVDSSSSCEGDAWAAGRHKRNSQRMMQRHFTRFMGTMFPIFIVTFVHVAWKRYRRRWLERCRQAEFMSDRRR